MTPLSIFERNLLERLAEDDGKLQVVHGVTLHALVDKGLAILVGHRGIDGSNAQASITDTGRKFLKERMRPPCA